MTDATQLHGPEHVRVYEETDGEVGHDWRKGSPILILTTTGRKSGEERKNALIYGMAGDDPMIVASKGGNPQHPAWYLNLRDEPEVQVQIKGDKFPAKRARRHARGAPRAVGADGRDLARLRQLPAEDRPGDPDRDPRARGLGVLPADLLNAADGWSAAGG